MIPALAVVALALGVFVALLVVAARRARQGFPVGNPPREQAMRRLGLVWEDNSDE